MSSAENPVQQSSPDAAQSKRAQLKIVLPYAIIILAQTPLLFLYYKNLVQRPYYGFTALLGLVALGYFLYSMWPRHSEQPFFKSRLSTILLVVGLGGALLATALMTPWFAMFSTICLLGSLLARTRNEETGRSLLPLTLLLLVFLQPPSGYDFDTVHGDRRLVTMLQQQSSHLSSYCLDLLGYKHNLTGNVIAVPMEHTVGGVERSVKEYNVEQACSGIQSFFTLLFVTVIFIIVLKRPWFRAFVLLLSAMFWAVVMNTIRISMIPIADLGFGLDLSSGFSHQLLGYAALLIGALLILSTDQFLLFLFGPVDDSAVHDEEALRHRMARGWNRVIAGSDTPHEREPASNRLQMALVPIAVVMALMFVYQAVELVRVLNRPAVAVRFFDYDPTMSINEEDAPETIETDQYIWRRGEYRYENRSQGSDLGERSDSWTYYGIRRDSPDDTPSLKVFSSFDQTFPGWHELTTCYRSDGWKLVSGGRRRVDYTIEGTNESWPFIEAEFEKVDTGQRGYLLFSLFDRAGEPFEAPGSWGDLNSFMLRVRNRLSHRIRARLFHGEGYQVQSFTSTPFEMRNAQKQAIIDSYLVFREHLRKQFANGEVQLRSEVEGAQKHEQPEGQQPPAEANTNTSTSTPMISKRTKTGQ